MSALQATTAGATTLDGEHARGGNARDSILLAAIEEFSTWGFEGTKLTAVAKRAGVTQPLVNYHFGSKDGLWSEAMVHLFAPLRSNILEAAAGLEDLGPHDRLKVVLRRFVLFSAQNPQVARIVALEAAMGTDRTQWLFDEYVKVLHDTIAITYDQGVLEGALKPLPVQHVTFICTTAATLLFSMPALALDLYGLDVSTAEAAETHADTLVEIVFHGITDPGANR